MQLITFLLPIVFIYYYIYIYLNKEQFSKFFKAIE